MREPLSSGALQMAVAEMVRELIEIEPDPLLHPQIAEAFLTTVYTEIVNIPGQREAVQASARRFGTFLSAYGRCETAADMLHMVRRVELESRLTAESRARVVG